MLAAELIDLGPCKSYKSLQGWQHLEYGSKVSVVRHKKGFTLVELSIVLVIIGLLIGGVLVAQSMISATKIEGQVKQFQQFDAAIANFKTKYGCLPGDNASLDRAPGSNAGDCNGKIQSPVGNPFAGTAYWADEIKNFWYQLSLTENISKENAYSYTDPNGDISPGLNAPRPILGNGKSVIAVGAPGSQDWQDKNIYFISEMHINASDHFTAETTNSLKPAEIFALDAKMDDGLPRSGNVYAGYQGGDFGTNNWFMMQDCIDANQSPIVYRTDSNDYTCSGLVKVLAQIGDLQ